MAEVQRKQITCPTSQNTKCQALDSMLLPKPSISSCTRHLCLSMAMSSLREGLRVGDPDPRAFILGQGLPSEPRTWTCPLQIGCTKPLCRTPGACCRTGARDASAAAAANFQGTLRASECMAWWLCCSLTSPIPSPPYVYVCMCVRVYVCERVRWELII